MDEKRVVKYWWVGAIVLLGLIWGWGVTQMYFHQDDLDWLILANRSWAHVFAYPIGDHVNYVWRGLLKTEWELFGTNYPAYLTVSVLLHAATVGLFYRLAKRLGRVEWAGLLSLLLVVNTNWTETVLWMSGQTITITALLVLLAMNAKWEGKYRLTTMWLSSWTSALAIGLLVSTGLTEGWDRATKKMTKVGWGVVVVGVGLAMIYLLRATDGTTVEYSWPWVGRVGTVAILAELHTVIGRTLIPFDRGEILRIVLVGIGIVWIGWSQRARIGEGLKDPWVKFLSIQLIFYYLIVAVGRAQFGIGIMRAERYAYLGLILTLLILARLWRQVNIKRWMVGVVVVIVLAQTVGLWNRAERYKERPQQLRSLVLQLKETDWQEVEEAAYLPHFVLNDQRLKYRDVRGLFER